MCVCGVCAGVGVLHDIERVLEAGVVGGDAQVLELCASSKRQSSRSMQAGTFTKSKSD